MTIEKSRTVVYDERVRARAVEAQRPLFCLAYDARHVDGRAFEYVGLADAPLVRDLRELVLRHTASEADTWSISTIFGVLDAAAAMRRLAREVPEDWPEAMRGQVQKWLVDSAEVSERGAVHRMHGVASAAMSDRGEIVIIER